MIERSIDPSLKVRWFISTDAYWIKTDYARKYGTDKIIGTELKNVNITQNYDDKIIVVDSELLRKCDEIVVTGGSTFGFFGCNA